MSKNNFRKGEIIIYKTRRNEVELKVKLEKRNYMVDSKSDSAALWHAKAQIAKNYLEELELKRLNLLVEQFLSFAELQSVEQRVMYMKDWIQKLNDFLILNEKEILQNAGNVSHLDMEKK